MNIAATAAMTAGAYLLGSFPSGYLLGRIWGVNVLDRASGRTGGANVYRAAGIVAALITGAADVGKGFLAVWLAGQLVGTSLAQVLAGTAVVLGHVYSAFLGFRGGGGVATSLGALAAIELPLAAAFLVLLVVLIAVTRYASLSSLTVVTLMPLVLLALGLSGLLALTYTLYGVLAWAVIVNTHRPNIRRLLSGTERRLGQPSE